MEAEDLGDDHGWERQNFAVQLRCRIVVDHARGTNVVFELADGVHRVDVDLGRLELRVVLCQRIDPAEYGRKVCIIGGRVIHRGLRGQRTALCGDLRQR